MTCQSQNLLTKVIDLVINLILLLSHETVYILKYLKVFHVGSLYLFTLVVENEHIFGECQAVHSNTVCRRAVHFVYRITFSIIINDIQQRHLASTSCTLIYLHMYRLAMKSKTHQRSVSRESCFHNQRALRILDCFFWCTHAQTGTKTP